MTLHFGDDPYYGPGSPEYDYSNPAQTDYTNQLTSSPTYPGAGSPSSMPDAPAPGALIMADEPLVPSSPSDWALPDFAKKSPVLALGVAALIAGALWYAASRPAPRRRRRSRS